MSFAVRLKKYRVAQKLSLQSLADLVEVSKAHIWDLETERAKNPSLEVLKKLSTHLKIPIATLIGENPEKAEGIAQSESVVMYRDLQGLNEQDRETIKIMMERLKKRTDI
ncbi:MAG: transcriptional regulator [Robiginitomaculum sp.]|nr:MAG: transcriptional regulator [Robiginitomaculum sp.]